MSPKRQDVHFDDELIIYGETYYYRGTPDGTRKRIERSLEIKKGASQKDILKKKRDFLESIERLGSASGRNTFKILADKYVMQREIEAKNPDELSQSSIKELRISMRKHLIPYFASLRIEEISQEDFDDFCKYKLKKHRYNFKNHLKALNHFLGWCVQYKYLKYQPKISISKFAAKAHRERVVLPPDKIRALVEACEGKVILYVQMYLFMGMRNMEICKLKWSDINFEDNSLFIEHTSNRTRKARVVPINSWVYKLLRLESAKPRFEDWRKDYVFPAQRSKGRFPHISPDGGINNPWNKALEKAGLSGQITPHDCRAMFETYMHANHEFTDTQREKMVGAKIDVQKARYVKMQVHHVRGLEDSVNSKIEGMDEVVKKKIRTITGGNSGGKKHKK